eukprot:SAG31_NODE_1555_length_7895_cov_46.107748_6_plen_158_part_00
MLGAAIMADGTKSTYPESVMIQRNHVHNYGIYGKQTSAFFQALSSNTTVRDNVFHTGPRAHINLNDGFSGNNTIKSNLLFDSVRETADHGVASATLTISYTAYNKLLCLSLQTGPFNSWARMPYWTLNGVADGFDKMQRPDPRSSIVKQYDHILNVS